MENLEYKTYKDAFNDIGKILDVKPSTVKNMRDEYDPIHSNHRKGWHQRELRPSRIKVLEIYDVLSEGALAGVAKDILNKNITDNNFMYIENIHNGENLIEEKGREYTTRGITGRRAEEIFKERFEKGEILELNGELLDKRESGCGYDFEMNSSPYYLFEVKGLLKQRGSISFTDKEWNVAKQKGQDYFLVFINNIEVKTSMTIIRDPYKCLEATKNAYPTISINWNVDSNQVEHIKKKFN